MAAATVYSSPHPSVRRPPTSIALRGRSILPIAAAQHPATSISNACHPFGVPSYTLPFRRRSGHSANSSTGDWDPPERVDNLLDVVVETRLWMGHGDKHHWIFPLCCCGVGFETEQALFDYYIKTLATVVGSKEEAKKRIYRVSCASPLGFGAEIDENTKRKLCGMSFEDYSYGARNKDHIVRSSVRFTPMNWNHRLDNIFSYHHLSERNSKWNSDHWLINIKKPVGGLVDNFAFYGNCVKLLAAVAGSEKEAGQKIYIIWRKSPFGFGAEIDRKTSNRLKDLPEVLQVLPDYAFDIKDDRKVLVVSPSSHGSRFSYYRQLGECHSKDRAINMEEHGCVSSESNYSPMNFHSYICDTYQSERVSRSDCKHWFIIMEKPGSEFASMQQSIDFYIETLSMVVGSEEAKEKIYRIKCGSYITGFGAEIDESASNKLQGMSRVRMVVPDYLFNKCPKGDLLIIDALREMKVNFRRWMHPVAHVDTTVNAPGFS